MWCQMRVLITGITGRIGANLAAALRRDGHLVRGLVWPQDPRTEKLEGLGVELQYGTITEPSDVSSAVEGVEAIYHFGAAFQGGGPFTEEQYFEINVRGTFNMLEAARGIPGLRQFLFASTDAVYDKYTPTGIVEPIREDEMGRKPSGWYALSKSMGEELCNGYFSGYGVPVTVLRFCYVSGAGEIVDYEQFYLSKLKELRPEMAGQWEGEERLVVLRDQNGRLHKKHVADVRDIVHGCVSALGNQEAIGETFQLAGPRPFTWDEAVDRLATHLEIPVVEASVGPPPTFYEYDLSKPRGLLGFDPQYDIVRMIDDAMEFRKGERLDVLPTD